MSYRKDQQALGERLRALGRNLYTLRKQRQLTVVKLQELSRVHHSSISRIENARDGVPNIETLTNLAKALDVSLWALLSPSHAPNEASPVDADIAELRQIYEKLSIEHRKDAQKFIQFLGDQSRQEELFPLEDKRKN